MMDDSDTSSELSLRVADTLEFTLEDTLGMLKELKLERDETLERAYDIQINNQSFTPLNQSTDILAKQHQLTLSVMNQISNEKPDDYPIPNTIDMLTSIVTGLANQIEDVQERIDNATENLKRKDEDNRCLEEKKKGFEKMKEACSAANKNIASKTYEREIQITDQIFKEVRHETQQVVAELFPDNDHMKDFLAILCHAYFTSGDDVYVDLTPECTDAANFLLEAGLLAYHKYDENKVKLIDLYFILRYLFFTFFGNSISLSPFTESNLNRRKSLPGLQ